MTGLAHYLATKHGRPLPKAEKRAAWIIGQQANF